MFLYIVLYFVASYTELRRRELSCGDVLLCTGILSNHRLLWSHMECLIECRFFYAAPAATYPVAVVAVIMKNVCRSSVTLSSLSMQISSSSRSDESQAFAGLSSPSS
mmetsp:Transcript_11440/g.25480  ORF Transcript_11440/g.25480 Transcript_11440/m.25480 type:complete len:107 (-) Transcript_11440:636-956(-)